MNWFQKLERKFGRYAIHNLMYYIIILYGAGILISVLSPQMYYSYLSLDMSKIFQGQIWRLVTFLMQPPDNNLLLSLIMLYCYYMMGRTLEQTWGAFRFNLYYLIGVLGSILTALVIYLISGYSYALGTGYINLSLFFGIAMTYPDMQFLFLFIIPIKAKWLAIFEAVMYGYLFIMGGWVTKIEIVLSLLNVLLFFFLTRNYSRVNPKQVYRRHEFQKAAKKAGAGTGPSGHHKCAVCGRTDLTNPELSFRYCSKFEGTYEYCQEHLYTHQHVKIHQ